MLEHGYTPARASRSHPVAWANRLALRCRSIIAAIAEGDVAQAGDKMHAHGYVPAHASRSHAVAARSTGRFEPGHAPEEPTQCQVIRHEGAGNGG